MSAEDRIIRERAAALGLMREIGAGKVEVLPRFRVRSLDDVAALNTPGVGYLVQEVLARPEALGELTGRFDFPNQCNNVLAFPGLLRGALRQESLLNR